MTKHDWLEEQLPILERFADFFDGGRERFIEFQRHAAQELVECERATAQLLKCPVSPLRANVLQAHDAIAGTLKTSYSGSETVVSAFANLVNAIRKSRIAIEKARALRSEFPEEYYRELRGEEA